MKPILVRKGALQVVSNLFRPQLLQESKVSRFEKEVTINVGLYKDLELVSNEQVLVLNSTAEAPSERMHQVNLTLSAAASTEPFLKLKVF